jgi:uncharacterized membrane protein
MVTLNLGSGKWLAAALLASLALNLFIGGVFAGRLLSPTLPATVASGEFGEQRPIRRLVMALASNLDDAERETFITAITGREAEIRSAGRDVRAARRAALARIHATPFDRKALDSALVTLRQRQDALQVALQTAIADAVEKLPDDARQRIGAPGRRQQEEKR